MVVLIMEEFIKSHLSDSLSSALFFVLSQGPTAAQVRGWQERSRGKARRPVPGGRQPGNLHRGWGHPQAAGPRPAEQEGDPRRPLSGPRARGHPGPCTCQ